MARITIGETSGPRIVALKPGKNTIGTAADNDIVVNDASVSPHHGHVLVVGRQVWIADYGSVAGTFAGDQRVKTIELELRKCVHLGNVPVELTLSKLKPLFGPGLKRFYIVVLGFGIACVIGSFLLSEFANAKDATLILRCVGIIGAFLGVLGSVDLTQGTGGGGSSGAGWGGDFGGDFGGGFGGDGGGGGGE